MTKGAENLEKLFHEPGRLAIMTELTGAKSGLSFVELKEACNLTDGNLSRHITALEKALAVKVEKSFVESKPRTTVTLTSSGRKEFLHYLEVLEEVLSKVVEKTKTSKQPFALKLFGQKSSKSTA